MSVEDDDDFLIEELRVAREDLEYILELVKLEIRRIYLHFCPVCGKEIPLDLPFQDLKQHIKVCIVETKTPAPTTTAPTPTTAERRYSCSSCGKTFRSTGQYTRHRYFCSNTVNLADYHLTRVQQVDQSQQWLPALHQSEYSSDRFQEQEEDDPNVVHQFDAVPSPLETRDVFYGPLQDPAEYTPVAPSVDLSPAPPPRIESVNLQLAEDRIQTNPQQYILSDNVDGKANNTSKAPTQKVVITAKKVPQCPICGKLFKKPYSLRRHIQTLHEGERGEKCPVCSKSFKDKSALRNHVKGHTDERPFSCTQCNKTFRRKDSLTYHMSSHTDQKSFICLHCAKPFRNLKDLKSHEKLMHNRAAGNVCRYSCKHCAERFETPTLLAKHMRVLHGVTKGINCPVCRQDFLSKASLDLHTRTHTGAKPFDCQFCTKSFRRKFQRDIHEQRHNLSGEHRCTICNRSFPQASELRTHAAVHSTDKLKCGICDKSFNSIEYVRAHMKKQHEVPPSIQYVSEGEPNLYVLQGIQTISVKTEKRKTEDDTLTTKTVYVMEPDVPGDAGPSSMVTVPYSLAVPQIRIEKEVGSSMGLSAGKSVLEPVELQEQTLATLHLNTDGTFRF